MSAPLNANEPWSPMVGTDPFTSVCVEEKPAWD